MRAFMRRALPWKTSPLEVGTPFYCYSVAAMESRYGAFARAFDGLPATVCYSVKANSNLAVLRGMMALGAGADVVSGGELCRALKAGMAPGKIVFSGIGKTAGEIDAALEAGIAQINVESESELLMVGERARGRGVDVAVALRVNPDVDADTHEKDFHRQGGGQVRCRPAPCPPIFTPAPRPWKA